MSRIDRIALLSSTALFNVFNEKCYIFMLHFAAVSFGPVSEFSASDHYSVFCDWKTIVV